MARKLGDSKRVWLRRQALCAACGQWRRNRRTNAQSDWGEGRVDAWGGHDPCIRNLPGCDVACCGHGRSLGYARAWKPTGGVLLEIDGVLHGRDERFVLRFPGDVHPFGIRAAVVRFLRTGAVPGWARIDDERYRKNVVPLGCRFRTGLDRQYRRRRVRGMP
jgi:hypothetical protein